jgi:hypothetical protein
MTTRDYVAVTMYIAKSKGQGGEVKKEEKEDIHQRSDSPKISGEK